VPKLWEGRSFLSLKPLGSWTQDLAARIKFLDNWYRNGTPKIFWLPGTLLPLAKGFFFPQSFITATLQNFARKNVIAIDKLTFTYDFLDRITPENVIDKPDDGCFVYGTSI
jgi:dynein heavy chain